MNFYKILDDKNMKNEYLLTFLEEKGISYTVDRNPSEEKVTRIKQTIKRKADLYKTALERYTNQKLK